MLEHLDHIRQRYQIFANDIYTLTGFLIGYGLVNYRDDSFLTDFQSYISKKNKVSLNVPFQHQISLEAGNKEYEVPIFFTYLDEFRGIEYECLGATQLSYEQKCFDFQRRIKDLNLEYPKLPIEPPHKLKIVKIPNVKVHAFYYDKNDRKYYEQCFIDFEEAQKWAKFCFNIDRKQWGLLQTNPN